MKNKISNLLDQIAKKHGITHHRSNLEKTPFEWNGAPKNNPKYSGVPKDGFDQWQKSDIRLPNGMVHRIMAHNEDPKAKKYHALLDDQGNELASIQTMNNQVLYSNVNPEFKGMGHGKKLYALAALHHKTLNSDEHISRSAHEVWKDLKNKKGFQVTLAPYSSEQPEASIEATLKPHSVKVDPKKVDIHDILKTESLRKDEGDYLDKLVSSNIHWDRIEAAEHPNLKDHHLDKLLTDTDESVRMQTAEHPNLKDHHLDKLLTDTDESVRMQTSKHPNLKDHHINALAAQYIKSGDHYRADQLLLRHGMKDAGDSVHVSFGTGKLRKLRDAIDERYQGSVPKKQLEHDLKTNISSMGISHLLDGKGNLTSGAITNHIESMPKTRYAVTHSKWTGAQRHTKAPSNVLQVNLSSDQAKQLKEAGVWHTYQKMLNASKQSGHPAHDQAGIGWVRYTGSPKTGIHIDEIQSDLGQSFIKQAAAQIKAAKQSGQISEEQAQNAMKDAQSQYPEDHYQKISDIVFGGRHPSEALHEAFHQSVRDKGGAGSKVSIWKPEQKAAISGMNTSKQLPSHMLAGYGKIPEKMGYEHGQYGQAGVRTQSNKEHAGKDVWAGKIRKNEDPAHEDLQKAKKFNQKIRDLADTYVKSKGFNPLNHDIGLPKINEDRAKKLAAHYEQSQHDPSHHEVQSSYKDLINETMDQFNHIKQSGMKFTPIEEGQENPYKTSEDLHNDIANNNHMWYYPTDQGFGTESKTNTHPMLTPTNHHINGKQLLANDAFRIVHDFFGHGKEYNGFGPRGEEAAWRHHKQMYSPNAARALTAETRMQNSTVNYGKHADHNRANPQNTIYADQKAIIAPDWAMEHED